MPAATGPIKPGPWFCRLLEGVFPFAALLCEEPHSATARCAPLASLATLRLLSRAVPQYRASRVVPCRETVISRTAGRQRLPLPPEQGLRPTRLHSPSHHSPACALSPSLLCSWLMALGSYTDGLLPHTTIASGGSTPSVAAVGLATGGVQLMGPSSRSVLALTFSEKATLRSTGCIPAM